MKKVEGIFLMLIGMILGIAIGLFVASFICDGVETPTHVEQTTVTKWETAHIDTPMVKDSATLGYITRKLPRDDGQWRKNAITQGTGNYGQETGRCVQKIGRYVQKIGRYVQKTDRYVQGTGYYDDGVDTSGKVFQPPDSAEVIIPITQKKYEGKEYTAWVSGYEARLDSINILRRTDIVTKTLYVDKKRRRWGCVTGVGVGVNRKGEVQPMLGVTFGYRLF
jgi:hypothetical protein